MEPFNQTVLNASGFPSVLHPTLFKSSKDFSVAVNGALTRARAPILGIATLLTAGDALLEALAVATSYDDIFILYPRMSPMLGGPRDPAAGIDAVSPLLRGQKAVLVGFGMARIAMHIRHGLNTHVRGLELAEGVPPKERNLSPGAFVRNYLDPTANTFAVDTLWDALPADLEIDFRRLEHLALRAWLTARVAAKVELTQGLNQCVPADTMFLTSKYFKPIHQMLIEVEQMEAAKPRIQENDFRGTAVGDNGNIVISNDRFSNRVRPSDRKEVWMIDEADGLHRGTANRANGRQTHVAPRSNLGGVAFKAIFVVGKDEFNHADRARETFLLHFLQGKYDLSDATYHLIQKLYFPNKNDAPVQKIAGVSRTGRLNQSQADVVEAMVNTEAPFVIVHGPPGTGKTSTISAALQLWVQGRNTAWVVAQSNVAVKNIAERLSKDMVPFKLLVSKEFYHEWHEHIYDEQVKESLIRTDELPAGAQDNAILFHGVHVVLCTLSTLSNPSLEAKNIFTLVRMSNLVVDEASQIGIFNYMHLFVQFKHLRKVCFFGDPKQLPPFGQDIADSLQSVFDVRHLKAQSYFLNTQYRMPVPLGSFISDVIYNGKLRSEHQVKTYSSVAFIDVTLGEEKNDKKSFSNVREVQTVERLVRYYYQGKNYCVITPYDAQRNLLQKTLEGAGLRSDNVYNVDSFQGNEADFIIVSVVRSTSPGFLVSKNRVNVMLTRCRLGMVLVTSRAFLQQRNVNDTILGRMHQQWERELGREGTWRDWKAVAEQKADLPGRRANSHDLGLNLKSSPRGLSSSDDRLSVAVAPVSARSLAPSLPLVRTISDLPLRRRHADSAPTMGMKSSIHSITENLQHTHLEMGSPRLPSSQSQSSLFSPPNESTNRRDDPRRAYAGAFPGLPSGSQPQPVASSAWGKGPPLPSRTRPSSSNPFGSNLPSQKLTALKKQAPSQMLASTKKSQRNKIN